MNTTNAANDSPMTSTIASVSVNLILSLPLNAYVLWLILRASRETVTSDFLSLNLAVSQLFFAGLSMWYLSCVYLSLSCAVKVFAFALGFPFTAQPVFQCCICIEYYVGVVHPVLFLKFKPLRYRVACCCGIWLIGLGSCIYHVSTNLIELYLYLTFIQSVLLLCVMLFCCLSVLRALKRPGPGDNNTGKKTSNAMKRKAFKIISLIMVSMAFNLLLFITVIPMQHWFNSKDFFRVLDMTLDFSLVTGFLQPLLYLHRSGKLPWVKKV